MLKRILGGIAMVLSVLGILISIIFGVLVWAGHGAASDGVNSAASSINSTLQSVEQRLTDLNTSVSDAKSKVQDINSQAKQIAATNPIGDRIVTELMNKFDSTVGVAYTNLRQTYISVRERAQSLADKVRTVDRLIPGFNLPETTGDRLNAVDDRLKEIDTGLVDLHNDLSNASLPSLGIAQKVADITGRLDNAIGEISSAVADYTTKMDTLQGSVSDTQSKVLGWITLGAVLLTLLALWFVLLHLGLFGYGRAWFRGLPWIPWSGSADQTKPGETTTTASPESADIPGTQSS